MSENSETELKPCPLCDGTETSHGYDYPPARGAVQCHDCDLIVLADTEADAVAAWNRRPLPSEGRRLGLEEALQAVGQSAWKHAGSDAYSQGMDAGATHQLKASLQSLRALIDRKE